MRIRFFDNYQTCPMPLKGIKHPQFVLKAQHKVCNTFKVFSLIGLYCFNLLLTTSSDLIDSLM